MDTRNPGVENLSRAFSPQDFFRLTYDDKGLLVIGPVI